MRKCFEIVHSNSPHSLSINILDYLDDHLLTKYCHMTSLLTLCFCLWSSCNKVCLGTGWKLVTATAYIVIDGGFEEGSSRSGRQKEVGSSGIWEIDRACRHIG